MSSELERTFAEVLADIVHVESVPLDSHFFDDLGADSLVMARFCARARKREDLPSVSMKDIYGHPTIRSLAAALAPAPARQGAPTPAPTLVPAPPSAPVVARRASSTQYVVCGTLQLLLFLGTIYLTAVIGVDAYQGVSASHGLVDVYLRSVLFGGATFLSLSALPILAKWVLIGRWKPQQIQIWSLGYVRFWIVKTLVQKNPLAVFAVGSPLYGLYLRALGAKVGPGVAVFSRNVPVCTDLLTIGAGSVIRKDSFISCYRAHDGLIEIGPVTLGQDVLVGEHTVIDIRTSMGDGAQLGHTSSLHAGQAVPAGETWHGSPAQRADVDYRAVEPTDCGLLRRAVFSTVQLLNLLFVGLPLAMAGIGLLTELPQLGALTGSAPGAFTSWMFYRDAFVASLVIFFGAVILGLVVMLTVPRLFGLTIKPNKVYPLFGFHYGVHRAIARWTNIKFFAFLFGDSSCITHYLGWLGYDLSPVEQTGSNFGQRVKHETPHPTSVGQGTVVADGLSIINADFSSTSFRVSPVSIGRNNFLGNNIAYPSQGRTGDNCLLATKVMVPIDGEVRQGVGLLGSPSFEIPRSVLRDSQFELDSADEVRRRLVAKNRHNAVTIGLFLLVRWLYFFGVTLLWSWAAHRYDSSGAQVIALANVGILLFSVVYFVLVERAVSRLAVLKPEGCSIYERDFWRHERFWKVPAQAYLQMFNGTPFKNVIWRLLGVRIGRRVFDDGCGLVERTFVTIGDDCTLNVGSIIQTHSQEDRAFKSDHSRIGSGCTLGVGAFVHYDVTMGDGAVLAPDSFLMKGEEMPPLSQWGGNPAREMQVAREMAEERPAETATAAALSGGTTR